MAMERVIPFVKRYKEMYPRNEGYSTAISSRYEGWGGAIRQPRTVYDDIDRV